MYHVCINYLDSSVCQLDKPKLILFLQLAILSITHKVPKKHSINFEQILMYCNPLPT